MEKQKLIAPSHPNMSEMSETEMYLICYCRKIKSHFGNLSFSSVFLIPRKGILLVI